MILNKTTTGFVVQKFDSETGRCLAQEFVASDQVEWGDQQGTASRTVSTASTSKGCISRST
jgi:hypothetical protein